MGEGSAGIFRYVDVDGAIARMRSCLHEAIEAAGGAPAVGVDASKARLLPGSPEGDPPPHIPDIVHSTALRWKAEPADCDAAREAFARVAADWEPLDIFVSR